MIFKIYNYFFNNILFNNVLLFFKLDNKIFNFINPYNNYSPEEGKSLQEIAGYSHNNQINQVLKKSHEDLSYAVNKYLNPGDKILDIGCGPGLFLTDFVNEYEIFGSDISEEMIKLAKKNTKSGVFFCGDFFKIDFPMKFNFIYCIGVLVYVPRSKIESFFEKVYDNLYEGGVFYLNYPHALSIKDVFYGDISYFQHSPKMIEKKAKLFFNIQKHQHAFDGRVIDNYDKSPYISINSNFDKTYKNSYLLIAKKTTIK